MIHQPCTVTSLGATPVGFGLRRARGPLGRVRDALKEGASTEELRAAIAELVSDGPHRVAALRMKEVIARDLAAGAAVRELEALALGARG